MIPLIGKDGGLRRDTREVETQRLHYLPRTIELRESARQWRTPTWSRLVKSVKSGASDGNTADESEKTFVKRVFLMGMPTNEARGAGGSGLSNRRGLGGICKARWTVETLKKLGAGLLVSPVRMTDRPTRAQTSSSDTSSPFQSYRERSVGSVSTLRTSRPRSMSTIVSSARENPWL